MNRTIKKMVSIIIPTANSENTIKRTIDSCLDQEISDFEIIVVLNGANSITEAIVKNEAASDSRVRFIEIPVSGRSLARNVGLKIAKGKYIQFVDSDDTITHDKLERSVSFLQRNKEYFAYCSNIKYFDDRKKKEIDNLFFTDNLSQLPYRNIFPINSIVFRNENLTFFRDDIEYNEDWLFWMENLFDKKVKINGNYIGGVVHITGRNSMRNSKSMTISELYVRSIIICEFPDRKFIKKFFVNCKYVVIYLSMFEIDSEWPSLNFVKRTFGYYYFIAQLFFKIPFLKERWINKVKSNSLAVYE